MVIELGVVEVGVLSLAVRVLIDLVVEEPDPGSVLHVCLLV